MRLIALLLLLCVLAPAQAQITPKNLRLLDSLRQVAAVHPADTLGSMALSRLLSYYLYRDTVQARVIGRQALGRATSLRDTARLANIEYNLGTLAALQDRLPASIAHHEASARHFKALGKLLWVGHNERNIGYHYCQLGHYPVAMRYLLRSLEKRTAAADSAGMADSYNIIGQIYIDLHNYPAAQAAYEQSLRRWQRLGVPLQVVNSLNHLAIIHRNEKRFDRAQRYLDQGFALARTDSTATFNLLLTLGVLRQHQGRWAESLPILRRAERLAQQNPVLTFSTKADLLSILGESLVHTRQVAQAAPYVAQALALSRRSQSRREEVDALAGLASVAAARQDYARAFSHQRAQGLLADSLRALAVARQVSELQVRYETAKKESQLREQQLIIRRRTTQLVAGLVIAALLAGLAYLLHVRHRLRLRLEHEQERQLLARQRMAAVLEAEENERQRIGSDLHDSIGQLLTAAQLNLRALGREMGTDSPAEQQQQVLLTNAVETVEESFREVRGISHNLIPNALLKRGLAVAVREFLDKLPTAGGLRAEVQVFGLDERVEPTTESVLFRVVQELVQNTIKHAQATEMVLQLVQSDTDLTIVLEDNGIGFDPQALGEQAGIGMRNMQSRVAYLGGQIHFDSSPGSGTTVVLEVPLPAPAPASPAS